MLNLKNKKNDDDYEEVKLQKLQLFAEKTGIVGFKKQDVNEFTNRQIEMTYKKIEKAILDKKKDITLMKETIDKLEGYSDFNAFEPSTSQNTSSYKRKKIKKTIMCQQFIETGFCDRLGNQAEPCLFAHNPNELDLVDNETKITNLLNTIKSVKKNISESKPPISWKPCIDRDVLIGKILKKIIEKINKFSFKFFYIYITHLNYKKIILCMIIKK